MKANPRYRDFKKNLTKARDEVFLPWSGDSWRFQDAKYPHPEEILSGEGSRFRGGRWNRKRHNRAVYGSVDAETAVKEVTAWSRKLGLKFRAPQIFVAIGLDLSEAVDLTDNDTRKIVGVSLKSILNDDWEASQASGQESLCQALGRAVFTVGGEAIIAPSSAAKNGVNIAYFPENRKPGSRVAIYKKDVLEKILKRRKK